MDCPRCQLTLETTEYEGVMVEVCQTCLGFWLDRGELGVILDLQRLKFSEEERTALLDTMRHPHKGPTEPGKCPRCSEVMTQKRYDSSVQLIIDECPEHGVWLDGGEMKTIQVISEQSQGIHRMLLQKLGLSKN
jgi:Zn-finger nucleic acid-binding protein